METINIRGGGLWGGLLAYRLHTVYPDLAFHIYEKNETFGGNHTWSFHGSDVPEESLLWLSPFIVKSWDGHRVEFPRYSRDIKGSYHTITSERFHEVLSSTLPASMYTLGRECPEGKAIDATGAYPCDGKMGFQKFLGLEIELGGPHGLSIPTLMDAKVGQEDGFRFFYYLPLTETRLLIEDTYYSSTKDLDKKVLIKRVLERCREKGWKISHVIREESGVLPLPFDVKEVELTDASTAGIFHDVTGYSLPDAVRFVSLLSKNPSLDFESIRNELRRYRKERARKRSYYQLLNRMMFQAAPSKERYRVLEHFYTLSPELIQRFYRGENHLPDKVRIFLGRPPVPILGAVKSFIAHKRWYS